MDNQVSLPSSPVRDWPNRADLDEPDDDDEIGLSSAFACVGDGGEGGGEAAAGRGNGGGAANLAVGGTSVDIAAGGVVGWGRRGRAAASADSDGSGTGAVGAA